MALSSSETNCTHLSFNNTKASNVYTHVIILIVLDILVTLSTIMANGLFLVILCKSRQLSMPSNVLVCALCCSDLFVGLVSQFLYLTILFLIEDHKTVPDEVLTAFHVLFALCSGSSCWIVAAISLDRFVAVFYPYMYRRVVTCKTHASVITTLCLAWSIYTLSHISKSSLFKNFQYTLFALTVFVILAVIFTYLSIYYVIRKHRKTIPVLGQIDGDRRMELLQVRREKQKSFAILPIIGIFLLLHLPYLSFSFYFILWPEAACSETLLLMFLWDEFFLLLSSLTNPLVYGLRRREFRISAARLFSISK